MVSTSRREEKMSAGSLYVWGQGAVDSIIIP